MTEFLPPQASTTALNRPIGIDDIAKASANAARPQEPAWRSGIIDTGLAPFPAALYKFENQWHEILNQAHVKVYAGSLGEDPSQGVIVIQTISLDNRSAGEPRVIRAPNKLGSLRIIAANGTFLTLRSAQGTELALDVETGQLSIR